MKLKQNKYINFSKAIMFVLLLAFFLILFFDAYVALRLSKFLEGGGSLDSATVIGTIVSVMSGFGETTVLFGAKHYFQKAGLENSVGYDARTNTTTEERLELEKMKTVMEDNFEGGEVL